MSTRTGLFVTLVLALVVGALSAVSASAPFPSSPNAFGRIEERTCPKRDSTTGVTLIQCQKGLAGKSTGEACWMGVSYASGQERMASFLCTVTCTDPNLKPDRPCTDACFTEFKGKVTYRSTGALEAGVQAALRRLYDDLIDLVKSERNPARYRRLGGDQKRDEIKQEIVEIALERMIPFDSFCTPRRGATIPGEQFRYVKEYSGSPPGGVQGSAAMETDATTWTLRIYESAFYDRNGNIITIASPDELAAAFLHEMIHWNQENYGYGPNVFGDLHTAHIMLHEVMAYDKAEVHPFYQTVLTQDQRYTLVTVGRLASIRRFKEAWANLSVDDRKTLARWAWRRPDGWMRSKMYFHPMTDGGIWGMLCTAHTGRGPCGMIQ